MLSSALYPGTVKNECIRKQRDIQLIADVDGGLLGSAPSLDVWTVDGTGAQQAASPVTDLATSSSSGLGTLPIASLHLTRITKPCVVLASAPFTEDTLWLCFGGQAQKHRQSTKEAVQLITHSIMFSI